MAAVFRNLTVMLVLGAIVLTLSVIVIFPLLSRGTWHSDRAIR